MLLARLRYLLTRFEDEFFHIQPDLGMNRSVKSIALSSILNEALNLQEAAILGDGKYFDRLKMWGKDQDWEWNDITIRFTWWPVCEMLQPFQIDSSNNDKLSIIGRDANNNVKHYGDLASLGDVMHACAAAWFFVVERAREAKIFLGSSEMNQLFRIYDCYELINSRPDSSGSGYIICRPTPNIVSYPVVRGHSEVPIAEAAFESRLAKAKKSKKA